MRNQQPIIIKRGGRRGGDDEGGGGAWKVAFADFTMAMMALFLVLWITSSASQEELETAAEAARSYTIFSGNPNPFELGKSANPLELEGYPSIIKGMATEILTSGRQQVGASLHNQQMLNGTETGTAGPGKSLGSIFDTPLNAQQSMMVLADLIRELGSQLEAFDNLAVDLVPQGLRIRLQDSDDRQMFARGGATMDPFFEDMLLALAPVFGRIDNNLVISGHTDSVPFQSIDYSNWELSGARALMARKFLQAGGTPPGRILQVAAMADRVPAYAKDPSSSANRRIEILVLTERAGRELLGLFDQEKPENAVDNARDAAKRNQPVTR